MLGVHKDDRAPKDDDSETGESEGLLYGFGNERAVKRGGWMIRNEEEKGNQMPVLHPSSLLFSHSFSFVCLTSFFGRGTGMSHCTSCRVTLGSTSAPTIVHAGIALLKVTSRHLASDLTLNFPLDEAVEDRVDDPLGKYQLLNVPSQESKRTQKKKWNKRKTGCVSINGRNVARGRITCARTEWVDNLPSAKRQRAKLSGVAEQSRRSTSRKNVQVG